MEPFDALLWGIVIISGAGVLALIASIIVEHVQFRRSREGD